MIQISYGLLILIFSAFLLILALIIVLFRRHSGKENEPEKLLQESDPEALSTLSLLQATLDSTADGLLVVDHSGKMISFNKKFVKMWRIPPSIVSSRDDNAALSYVLDQLKVPQGFLRKVKELYGQHDAESYDILEFKDGRVFERFSQPQKFKGKCIGRVWSFRDVTERRKAEEFLRESEERIRMCIDHALDAVVVIDSHGKIISWNPQAERIFGWSRDEVIGKQITETVIPERFRKAHNEGFKRFLATGEGPVINKRMEFPAVAKDGHELPIELSVSVAHMGENYVFSAFLRDVSDRKRAEQEIEKYTEELKRSNKDLEQFAYVASHDLQEPLLKITLFGDLLNRQEKSTLSEKGQDYVERMQGAAHRMKDLVEDLLEYARVTTQPNPFEPVNLEEVVRDVLVDLEVSVTQSAVRISIEGLPEIDADRQQIRQLFLNLISNAIKFRKKERPLDIRIHGRLQEFIVAISVEDNGIGFEDKYCAQIFEPFQRLYTRSEYDGSGIGLAICQKIVQRHGGKIHAESKLGKGSQFIIELPIHQPGVGPS